MMRRGFDRCGFVVGRSLGDTTGCRDGRSTGAEVVLEPGFRQSLVGRGTWDASGR